MLASMEMVAQVGVVTSHRGLRRFLHNVMTASGALPASCPVDTGASCPTSGAHRRRWECREL
jgi:hypothetical protein